MAATPDSFDDLQRITDIPPLPARPADGHKGTFGRVLVVGGHEEMIGAPVMAGTAALRTGSGLVQIAVAKSILAACLSITPELIGLGLGRATVGKLLKAADESDALIVGPGLGQSDEAAKRLERLIRVEKPMVVDADALNLIAAMKRWPADFAAHAVLTPHPGEMKRLGGLIGWNQVPQDEAGRIQIATAAARAFGQVLVLKGNRTVVTDGKRVYVNITGDVTLAKAGTGDVLSGIIGSLLGQGMERFEAAALGTHLHGLAGQIAGERFGQRSAVAMEVAACISEAMQRIAK
jgi:NAD(P)H-hydrate epimerase